MSCLVKCPKCGAGRRFEYPPNTVSLHVDGATYADEPVTTVVECPCGVRYWVDLPHTRRHRVWLWVYDTERDGRDRLNGRQVEVELPYRVWQPDVVELVEVDPPTITFGEPDRKLRTLPDGKITITARRVAYDKREEWLNRRPYRVYYVRRTA